MLNRWRWKTTIYFKMPVEWSDVQQHHPPSHRPRLKCSVSFCISMELWENLRATNKKEQQCILHVSEERKSGQWASLCEKKRPLANLWGPLNMELRWARRQQTAAQTQQSTSNPLRMQPDLLKQSKFSFISQLSLWCKLFFHKTIPTFGD